MNLQRRILRRNCRSALEWVLPCSNFHLGSKIVGYTVGNHLLTAPHPRHRKYKFPTVYPTIYLPKWKFLTQLSPK